MADQMIEEAFLPMGWRSCDGFREASFKQTHPLRQWILATSAGEQMNMLGHDHVTSDGHSAPNSCRSKLNKSGVNLRIREQFPPMMRVEREEIKRWIVLLKHKLESRGPVRHK